MGSRKKSALDLDRVREQLLDLATSDYLISTGRVIEAIDALRRLDEGEYGVCANCEKPIARARLEIRPEATLCVACQSRQEQYLAA